MSQSDTEPTATVVLYCRYIPDDAEYDAEWSLEGIIGPEVGSPAREDIGELFGHIQKAHLEPTLGDTDGTVREFCVRGQLQYVCDSGPNTPFNEPAEYSPEFIVSKVWPGGPCAKPSE